MRLMIPLLLIASCTVVTAQDNEDVLRPQGRPGGGSSSTRSLPVILGIEAGLNVNFYGQGVSRLIDLVNSPEDVVKSGTGFSPMFGLFADVPLSSGIGLQFRAAYDAKSAGATKSDGIVEATVPNIGTVVEGSKSNVVDATTETEFGISMNAVTLAVLGRFDLTSNLFATFGPVVNLAVGDVTRTDRVKVLAPDDVFILRDYEGNPIQEKEISRESNLSQTVLPQGSQVESSTYSSVRVGLELGMGYRFNLTPTMYLAPNVRYQYFISPFTTDSYTSLDNSRSQSEGQVPITFDKATLNTLAFVLQLGFTL